MVNTNTIISIQTKRVFNVYHTIRYKSQWIIYLLECILCNFQYVGKSKICFNIRLNNYRKEVTNPKASPACVQFRKSCNCNPYFSVLLQLGKSLEQKDVLLISDLKTATAETSGENWLFNNFHSPYLPLITHTHTHTHTPTHTHTHVCVYVCIYIYIYIYWNYQYSNKYESRWTFCG